MCAGFVTLRGLSVGKGGLAAFSSHSIFCRFPFVEVSNVSKAWINFAVDYTQKKNVACAREWPA
jgi:hypothetical protein